MKRRLNKREAAKAALAAAGCICIMLAAGEDGMATAESLIAHFGLTAIAALTFYAEGCI